MIEKNHRVYKRKLVKKSTGFKKLSRTQYLLILCNMRDMGKGKQPTVIGSADSFKIRFLHCLDPQLMLAQRGVQCANKIAFKM